MFKFKKKKTESVEKVMAYSFIPFGVTKENLERPHMAKDKCTMIAQNMREMSRKLQKAKNELAKPEKLY